MKIKFLLFLAFVIFGLSQIPESFSEDYFAIPSCYVGTFHQSYVECSTKDSPPCPEPSFEKNGYCVVKKIDICKGGSILDDGVCIEREKFFGPDGPATARQSLQTGETLGGVDLLGWLGLVMSLFIVFAYVLMKIKKRKKENE